MLKGRDFPAQTRACSSHFRPDMVCAGPSVEPMIRFITLLALVALFPALPALAEEKANVTLTALRSTTIAGYVDTSIHWNLTPANSLPNPPDYVNPKRFRWVLLCPASRSGLADCWIWTSDGNSWRLRKMGRAPSSRNGLNRVLAGRKELSPLLWQLRWR